MTDHKRAVDYTPLPVLEWDYDPSIDAWNAAHGIHFYSSLRAAYGLWAGDINLFYNGKVICASGEVGGHDANKYTANEHFAALMKKENQ